jgi:hypothetical protein
MSRELPRNDTERGDKTHTNKLTFYAKAVESRGLKLVVTDGKHPL